MKTRLLGTYQIPTYALCALEYGDFSGMEDEDEENIKDFLDSFNRYPKGVIFDYIGIDEPYFSNYPEFGLPCEVVDTKIYEILN